MPHEIFALISHEDRVRVGREGKGVDREHEGCDQTDDRADRHLQIGAGVAPASWLFLDGVWLGDCARGQTVARADLAAFAAADP